MREEVFLGGIGGQGVLLPGQLLARAGMDLGNEEHCDTFIKGRSIHVHRGAQGQNKAGDAIGDPRPLASPFHGHGQRPTAGGRGKCGPERRAHGPHVTVRRVTRKKPQQERKGHKEMDR